MSAGKVTKSRSAHRAVRRVDEAIVDVSWKGLPAGLADTPVGDIPAVGLNTLEEGWSTPCAILRENELEQNIRVMSTYCADKGVLLAPHAKTSMAPQLLSRQIRAGAWGLTVASVQQLRLLAGFGFRRFLVANEIVDRAEARWLTQSLKEDPELEAVVFADSLAAVQILAEAAGHRPARPLDVLVEMGIVGARCGVRDTETAVGLGRAIDREPGLRLAGVSGFEGVVGMVRDAPSRARAREFGGLLATSLLALEEAKLITSGAGIGTAGGSLFFEEVLDGWSKQLGEISGDVPFILRSGCYVTQDNGSYHSQSPLGPCGSRPASQQLRPAIEVLARVISIPEPEFAVVNAGKRDVSYDIADPTLLWANDPGNQVASDAVACVGLNDQHAMFRGPAISQLSVGSLVGLGITHPCTTFDKWKAIPLVDDNYRVIELVVTYF